MLESINQKKRLKLKLTKRCNSYIYSKKRGRSTSFFMLSFAMIALVVSANVSFSQSEMPFDKDSVRNFLFTADAGQVPGKLRQRLNPEENFLELKGNTATLQLVSLVNQNMGRNGVGGVTHTGPISSLEIFKKTNLIEISFVLKAARVMISIKVKFWDDGETKVMIDPMNTPVSIDLFGSMYQIGKTEVNKGANK